MTETELGTVRCSGVFCAETHEPMTWNEAAQDYTHAGRCVFGADHRHLELTVYPAPSNPWPEGISWLEDVARRDKRLNDPELAAEYWRAKAADLSRLTWPDGVPTFEPESDILERFARRPHAGDTEYV